MQTEDPSVLGSAIKPVTIKRHNHQISQIKCNNDTENLATLETIYVMEDEALRQIWKQEPIITKP